MFSYEVFGPYGSYNFDCGFEKYSPIGCSGYGRRPIEPYCCGFGTDGLPADPDGLGFIIIIIGSGYGAYDPCVSISG